MRIGMLTATYWEVRRAILALGLFPTEKGLFEGGTGKHSISLYLTGLGQDRARAAAGTAARIRPDLMIATGFAGALRADILTGDLVIDKARSDASRAEALADAALRANIPCHQGAFFSSAHVVTGTGEKRRLSERTGAIAVEMESQGVFEALKGSGIPLLFVRAVSDALEQSLPEVGQVISPSGEIRPKGILKILARPREWGDLIRLIRGSKRAEESLAKILKEFLNHV